MKIQSGGNAKLNEMKKKRMEKGCVGVCEQCCRWGKIVVVGWTKRNKNIYRHRRLPPRKRKLVHKL